MLDPGVHDEQPEAGRAQVKGDLLYVQAAGVQKQSVGLLATHRCRLVHDPAGHPDEVVFRPSGHQGEVHRRNVETGQRAERGGDTALEGGRRRQPGTDGDVAVDQQVRAQGQGDRWLQGHGHGGRVGSPATG